MPKNAQTTAQLHSSQVSKVVLKILQARLYKYINCEDIQAGLRKEEEPEIKLPASVGSQIRKRVPEKHLLLLY